MKSDSGPDSDSGSRPNFSSSDRDIEDLLSKGVVNIDKPSGPTSHEVAAWVRDAAEVGKAAHTGTLDPRVTGCLPILLGKSARISGLFRGFRKEYVFVLELHGDVADVETVFDEFEGKIYQRPPVTSSVSRRVRTREIHELELLERRDRRVLGRVSCEAGTYIRKLCHDLGLTLGTGGHMAELRRTRTGDFRVEDSIYLQDFVDALALWREEGDESEIRRIVSPLEKHLDWLPHITVKESAVDALAHGAPLYPPGIEGYEGIEEGGMAVVYAPNGEAVCVGDVVTMPGDKDSETGQDSVLESSHVLVEPGKYPKGWD